MSFEDSMIEDGVQDEEEYLEHLMDEADKEWERQQHEQSTYQEEEKYYDDEDYYEEDDEEYYDELREQFRQWLKENPLKHKIFCAWVKYDYEWEDRCDEDNIFLDKFNQWKENEEYYIEQLKEYYHDYYPRILEFFEWKIENPIEEILRQPQIEYLRPTYEYPYAECIPDRELLIDEVEEYEEWIKNKTMYEQWINTASEEEKKEFWEMVNENEFQNDTSIKHTRECIIKQLEDDKTLDITKEKVLSWYDEDEERGRNFYYVIKCVQNYFDD